MARHQHSKRRSRRRADTSAVDTDWPAAADVASAPKVSDSRRHPDHETPLPAAPGPSAGPRRSRLGPRPPKVHIQPPSPSSPRGVGKVAKPVSGHKKASRNSGSSCLFSTTTTAAAAGRAPSPCAAGIPHTTSPCAACAERPRNARLRAELLAALAAAAAALDAWADDVGVGDGASLEEMEWQREAEHVVVFAPSASAPAPVAAGGGDGSALDRQPPAPAMRQYLLRLQEQRRQQQQQQQQEQQYQQHQRQQRQQQQQQQHQQAARYAAQGAGYGQTQGFTTGGLDGPTAAYAHVQPPVSPVGLENAFVPGGGGGGSTRSSSPDIYNATPPQRYLPLPTSTAAAAAAPPQPYWSAAASAPSTTAANSVVHTAVPQTPPRPAFYVPYPGGMPTPPSPQRGDLGWRKYTAL